MATPAVAVAERNGIATLRSWLAIIIVLLAQIAGFAYTYGVMSGQVQSIRQDIRDIKDDIRDIRHHDGIGRQ